VRGGLISVIALLALPACSALQIISDTSPSAHYQKTAALRYAAGDRGLLDYYEPIDLAPTAPTIVFFYGGGWRSGEREKYEFVASALTEAGFRVVIPDYRRYPEVRFPDFMVDAAGAVAWTLSRLEAEALDAGSTQGIYLMGHSAGAHIAALLALDPSYLMEQSVSPAAIIGLIGLSGPYDFLPLQSGYLEEVFPEDLREASQPINQVSSTAPPTLLIHGQDDDVVEPGNSERFARALAQAGAPVELKRYPGTGHATVAAALAPRLVFLADTLEDTIRFIEDREAATTDTPSPSVER
jgi:acetyl esterase/lipase